MSDLSDIEVTCEGSLRFATWIAFEGGTGLCPMCGQAFSVDEAGRLEYHDRKDILAMLQRGDFG